MKIRSDEISAEESHVAIQRYAMLLKGYERFQRRKPAKGTARLAELLNGFISLRPKPLAVLNDRERDLLIEGHERAIESDLARQEAAADDFNLLDVIDVTYRETRHSMVLAWLLDADPRKHRTHAQGSLGLQLFLRQVGLPVSLAIHRYWVRREVAGEEARVDIEVASRGHFLIHVENKIRSPEATRQTSREWSDLQRRAATLGISDQGSIYGLFLTPGGILPENANFRPVSWRQVAHVLEEFATRSKPTDVKLFATHYARALRKFVVRDEIEGDND